MNIIKNDRQLKITKDWISKFEKDLINLEEKKAALTPEEYTLYKNGMVSMIDDLNGQVKIYTDNPPQQPSKIVIYNNGTLGFFKKEQQIGDLQEIRWMELIFAHLESININPLTFGDIEYFVNNKWVYVRPYMTEEGHWNWQFIDKD